MKKTDLTKEWLIREIASRASFTASDVRIILNTMIDVISEVIRDKKSLIVKRFFRLSVSEIPEHDGWNAVENKSARIKKSSRVVLRASRYLLDFLKNEEE